MKTIARLKTKKPAARRERFVPIWDWELDQQPDLTWLVDRRLPEGGFGVLFGESGLLKTFIAIDLAYRLASGLPWYDCEVQQGAVLYVAAEGSIGGLRRRAQAWREAHKIGAAQVAFLPHSIVLHPDNPDVLALVSLINSMDPKPVLVVVDTVSRCLEGNENTTDDMGKYVRAADTIREATGAFVLHIHHTPKKDPLTERGSNALRGAADVMLRVARRAGGIELSCAKQRDGDDRWIYTVKRTDVADSAIVELTRGRDRRPEDSDTPTPKQGEDRIVSILSSFSDRTALSGELKTKAKEAGIRERTFYGLVASLVDEGRITKVGKGKTTRYTATANSLQSQSAAATQSVTAATATPRRGAVHAVGELKRARIKKRIRIKDGPTVH